MVEEELCSFLVIFNRISLGGDVGDGDGDDGYPSPLPQLGLRPTHSPPENVQVKATSFFNVLKATPPSYKHYTIRPWKLCNLYVGGKICN